nr:hypothetical protein Iba_chr02bCG23670 [Ipomoea batatas]
MEPKRRRKQRARMGGLCQQRMMTSEVRHVVTSITAITANPAMDRENDILNQSGEWCDDALIEKLLGPCMLRSVLDKPERGKSLVDMGIPVEDVIQSKSTDAEQPNMDNSRPETAEKTADQVDWVKADKFVVGCSSSTLAPTLAAKNGDGDGEEIKKRDWKAEKWEKRNMPKSDTGIERENLYTFSASNMYWIRGRDSEVA